RESAVTTPHDPATAEITRRAPRWAWDTIDDTLLLDAHSKHIDPDRRREIENAVDVMKTVSEESVANQYTFGHMENAVMLMEHLTERIIDDAKHIPANQNIQWLADIGGSAELRAHVIHIAKELEDQFQAIGLKWDNDCGFYGLAGGLATAIVMHPKTAPAQLVRDVLNAELKIVFRPEQ